MIENICVIAPIYLKREFSTESLYNTSQPQFISDSNAFPNVDR